MQGQGTKEERELDSDQSRLVALASGAKRAVREVLNGAHLSALWAARSGAIPPEHARGPALEMSQTRGRTQERCVKERCRPCTPPLPPAPAPRVEAPTHGGAPQHAACRQRHARRGGRGRGGAAQRVTTRQKHPHTMGSSCSPASKEKRFTHYCKDQGPLCLR